jgi:hypothetical protein
MGGVFLYGAGTDAQNPYGYVRRVCEWAKSSKSWKSLDSPWIFRLVAQLLEK